MKGFFNQILHINVTDKTYTTEEISDDIYTEYLGGKGLGSYLLLKQNPPRVDPLAPENRILFAVGCITDTRVWGSSRYGVFTKSPLTGIYSESYSGGKISTPMSRTGYDAIMIEGASPEPLYLEVADEGVQFHSAADLWGKGTYETEDAVKKKTGVPGVGAVVIGPAGENLVRFALIENDYWRSCGRTGVGAVLGAKKIKAVVFHGQSRRAVAHPDILNELHAQLAQKRDDDPKIKNLRKYGTPNIVAITNMLQAFPVRYWSEGTFTGWEKLSPEYFMETCDIKPRACQRCFIACGKLSEVKAGRHKGLKIEGPEYETIFAFGGLCLIDSIEEVMYLNDLCDNLGIDTMTAGNLAAFTIEASRRGKISEKLDYGDVDAIVDLLNKTVRRQGVGAILAEGIRHAAKVWGLEDLAVHVKGQEPAGYDPRSLNNMALAYATSHRGACHLRSRVFPADPEEKDGADDYRRKVERFVDSEEHYTLMDCLILCRFYRDIVGWNELSRLIYGVTGVEFDKKALKKIAANTIDATRRFNIQEGVTRKDDTIPKRFFKEGLGPDKKVINKDDLDTMISEYYRLRGWDENGIPLYDNRPANAKQQDT
jgi:aldehyde:ferredoxin oxidoreductase